MEDITLQQLLEAGCHFGHKAERWHPKAAEFIYTKKDGIHIIDLAKTKAGLDRACAFVKDLIAGGGELLFIATKRQAMGVVKEAVEKAAAPYLVERWIGGFLTNWEEVKKNIDKIINLENDRAAGRWKKMPKHEQGKLGRYIDRLKIFYGGVLTLKEKPNALFIVDVKREHAAVREAQRVGIPVVAIVDTNSDPTGIHYVIPANDDAVGSIQLIAGAIAAAYREGKDAREKESPSPEPTVVSSEEEPPKKKRGRPKKII
ncbi:30S ribosomal protein S2 [Candidatus Gottesmanbacteria bacterium]|nr:30S ribosomal protein S2 [Candidatus Gottesmanbacteria bacterium]